MAGLPKIAKLSLENLTGASQEDRDKVFVAAVNSLNVSAVSSLDKGLSFTENFDSQYADLLVTVADDWQPITYGTDWGIGDAGYAPPGFRKDADGRVHLRGLVATSGSANLITLLPKPYWPEYASIHCVAMDDVFGVVDTEDTGEISWRAGVKTGYVSLDSISFQAADRTPVAHTCFPKNIKCTLKGKVGDVYATRIVDTATSLNLPSTSVDWRIADTKDSKQIMIRNIPGLMPNRSYKIRLRILSE